MRISPLVKLIALLSLVLAMLLCAIACQPTPPDNSDENGSEGGEGNGSNQNNQGNNDTVDRTNPAAGTYKINFCLGETASFITHYYNAGETITPPETIPSLTLGTVIYVFDGWDGVTFLPVSGDATYRSNVKTQENAYTVTYIIGEEKKEVKTPVGTAPAVPDISEFTLADGVQFCGWDKTVSEYTEDTTVYGIVTKYFDPEYFLEAYKRPLLRYSSAITDNDNANSATANAAALTCLLIEENLNPQGGAVVNRIIEHLTSVVTKDQAPAFDACCYWSYAPHSGSIAIAKATPSVWEKVPMDIKFRLDVMMRAFAYLESFATSDYNEYKTGPGMKGNYSKTWNPNYRLANIPVMVYVTHYFGDGDMDAGADIVNSYLKGFDATEYDNMIDLFQKYGWRRAMLTWTADGRVSTDGNGVVGLSAKEVMVSGGQAVGDDTSTSSDLLVALGNGAGVGNGGKDYLYGGFTLKESDWIIRSLLMHNYGDNGLSKNNKTASFLEVKSDHWYDKDGDGIKEIVAWIMTGVPSPYEGQYGMMKEFASGNRSSTGYCSHDFLLTTTMIYTCKVLGIYDLATDEYTDKYGINIREAIIVGNEDFLFKNEQGYQGYATGSYGESTSSHSEKSEAKGSYFALKSLWRLTMKPELEAALENPPEPNF